MRVTNEQGLPDAIVQAIANDDGVFWSKVDRRGAEACWEWTAVKTSSGYGQIRISGRSYYAHRLALASRDSSFGIFSKMLACHTCDNPPCCNPAHLYAGTHLQNLRDAEDRGRVRHRSITGEGHYRTTLTADTVRAIRAARAAGGTCTSIARSFGVSPSTVWNIYSGRVWRSVA